MANALALYGPDTDGIPIFSLLAMSDIAGTEPIMYYYRRVLLQGKTRLAFAIMHARGPP